eukprot:2313223-Rhodomonas_salina.1
MGRKVCARAHYCPAGPLGNPGQAPGYLGYLEVPSLRHSYLQQVMVVVCEFRCEFLSRASALHSTRPAQTSALQQTRTQDTSAQLVAGRGGNEHKATRTTMETNTKSNKNDRGNEHTATSTTTHSNKNNKYMQ